MSTPRARPGRSRSTPASPGRSRRTGWSSGPSTGPTRAPTPRTSTARRPPAGRRAPTARRRSSRRAVALALFDYLRKSRANGFVVSLSGGADSAAVAVLVALMVRLAADELGPRGVIDRLPSVARSAGLERAATAEEITRALLTLRLPSRRATVERHDATRRQGGRRGGRRRVPRAGASTPGRGLRRDGQRGDRPAADLGDRRHRAAEHPGPRPRARRRGCWPTSAAPCCWRPATAARRRSATPRWTATPAAGWRRSPASTRPSCVDWLRWMETTGPVGVGPMPVPSAVNAQQPTAELRPAGAEPDRRGRPDAVPGARRDRARRDPRQTPADGGLPRRRAPSSPTTTRSSSAAGSSGSSGSGAATSGSASATPRASTSTTRTSTPKPGAASRSSAAATRKSWRS